MMRYSATFDPAPFVPHDVRTERAPLRRDPFYPGNGIEKAYWHIQTANMQ